MRRTPLQPSELSLLKLFLSHTVIEKIKQALDDGRRVEKIETELKDPGHDYTAIEIDGKEVCRINGY
jgi:hypothetical protein